MVPARSLEEIFGVKKPIIGMVHLADLYSPQGLDYVISRALADARNLHLEGKGVDALLVENWEEKSTRPFVEEETVNRMSSVIDAIITKIDTVIGVNALHNDYRAAFRLAREYGLSFLQLDVYSDEARTDFTHTKGVQFDVVVDPDDVRKHRQGTKAALLVNIHPKNYKPLTAKNWDELEPVTESAKRAIDKGADGIVVTKATGSVPDLKKFRSLKQFVDSYRPGFPIFGGSGITKENVGDVLVYASGVIVGTALKINGVTDNPVDPARVEAYMGAVRSLRQQ